MKWQPSLREMHAHVAKLPMLEAIDGADDQADDEGEEDDE